MSNRAHSRPSIFARLRRRAAAPGESGLSRRRPVIECLEARIAPASLISTFTKAVTVVGNAGATSANPGDTLHYTVNFTNNSGSTITNASFQDFLDSHTTLVAGSVHISPIALDDSFTTVGNTLLEAGGVTPSGSISVTSPASLLSNDLTYNAAGGNDSFSIVSHTAPAHGTLPVFNANGSFSYLPNAGFSGTDTFTYTFKNTSDTVDTLTDTATVTISVGSKVWYIDNNAGTNGDGRSVSPFNSATSFTAVNDGAAGHPGTGDTIYLAASGTNYTGGATLLGTQTLVGAGDALVVDGFTLKTAGASPTLLNSAGNALTLASGNTIHGFNIGATSGIGITGASIGTLTVDHVTVNTGTGGALSLSTGTFAGTGFSSTTGKSVSLTGIAGTVNLGSGALSSTTSDALYVSGGSAGINYSGTITEGASGTGHSVDIIGKISGTVALSGAVNDSGAGILLNANTGATINLTGGVVVNSGANTAFTATGGGTVTVTGASNTLTTTSGGGLNVANTTIGAAGLTFLKIASGAGANDGIILDTTGAFGGLTVTGSGTTANSGGVISGKTGADGSTTSGIGIYLNATNNVSLANMDLEGNQNYGIRGFTVAGFSLTGSTVGATATNGTSTSADADTGTLLAGEGSVRFNDLTGTAAFTNVTLDNGFARTVAIHNYSGTLNLSITNSTVNESLVATTASDAILMQSSNAATMNLTVTGSHFTAYRQFAIDTNAVGTSSMNITVSTSDFSDSNTGVVGAAAAMQLGSSGTDNFVTFNIHDNTFRHGTASVPAPANSGAQLVAGVVSGAGTFYGKFVNNTVGVNGVAFSGAGQAADALRLFASGNNGASHGGTRYLVQGNTIQQYGEVGIQINARQGNATIDATVLGNTIRQPGTAAAGAFAGI